jgi:hypothetical protein
LSKNLRTHSEKLLRKPVEVWAQRSMNAGDSSIQSTPT